MDLVRDFLGNWILVLWVAFYVLFRYVLPGIAIGWVIWRAVHWIVDRIRWVIWFSKN